MTEKDPLLDGPDSPQPISQLMYNLDVPREEIATAIAKLIAEGRIDPLIPEGQIELIKELIQQSASSDLQPKGYFSTIGRFLGDTKGRFPIGVPEEVDDETKTTPRFPRGGRMLGES